MPVTFVTFTQAYYAKKSKQDKAVFSDKLKKKQDEDEAKRKAQQQQDSIIEMMKMQMRDAQERADKQLEEALNRPKSASSVSTNPEIYELRDEVEKLENKLYDMMNQVEDKENENVRLGECECIHRKHHRDGRVLGSNYRVRSLDVTAAMLEE